MRCQGHPASGLRPYYSSSWRPCSSPWPPQTDRRSTSFPSYRSPVGLLATIKDQRQHLETSPWQPPRGAGASNDDWAGTHSVSSISRVFKQACDGLTVSRHHAEPWCRTGWNTERVAQLGDLETVLSSDATDMEPAIRLAEQLNEERSDGDPHAAPLSVAVLPEESPSDSGRTAAAEPSGTAQLAGWSATHDARVLRALDARPAYGAMLRRVHTMTSAWLRQSSSRTSVSTSAKSAA